MLQGTTIPKVQICRIIHSTEVLCKVAQCYECGYIVQTKSSCISTHRLQQPCRKSGKTFCHRQEKLAVFHLAERSRCQCGSLFNHQHRTGKRHWYQRISDEHLPHRRKTVTAEIRIKQPRRMSLIWENKFFGGWFFCYDLFFICSLQIPPTTKEAQIKHLIKMSKLPALFLTFPP